MEAVGVFDGLRKKHCITKSNLMALVIKYTELPLRSVLYAHRQTGRLVEAFHIRDAGTIVMKRPPNNGMQPTREDVRGRHPSVRKAYNVIHVLKPIDDYNILLGLNQFQSIPAGRDRKA